MNTSDQYIIKDLVLGKRTEYKRSYSPDLLQAIPRSLNRDKLGLTDSTLPFSGYVAVMICGIFMKSLI